MEITDKKKHISVLLITVIGLISQFTLTSCNLTGSQISGDWLIPESEIVDGGPGKDGIPSIDSPNFLNADEANFIPDNRMIIGVRIGDEVRAYPHQILDWHEIVNDEIGGKHVGIIFCPLTGTGQVWNREINGSVTEFGVSGLLFRNNLIPYDRNSDSNWSQMQLRSVNGEMSGKNVETFPVVETTWATWKGMYPNSKVHSTDTGFSRNYNGFTYGPDYSTNHNQILFPISNQDSRLQNKIRVLGLIDSATTDESAVVKAYPIERFEDGVTVLHDRVGSTDYVIAGSSSSNISAAFLTRLNDGTIINSFASVQNELPVVMEDEKGNRYDIFGYVVDGPNAGMKLEHAKSYTGYWFAWADFFSNIEIYDDDK